jgi:hypothetical protein
MCPDCGEALTADQPRPASPLALTAEQRHDIVEYSLSDWTCPKADELSKQLALSRIAFEWDGTTLHVPGAHEAEVDELIDVLDGANDAELTVDDAYELAEEPDVVEYEFTDWTFDQREQLVASLRDMELEFEWDGVVLAVNGENEATVDGLVVRIDPTFPVDDEPDA